MNALSDAVLNEFKPVFAKWNSKMRWSWGQLVRYLTALAWIESRTNPKAYNSKYGAFGIWQMIPKTWKRYSGTETPSYEPIIQARAYARLLDDSLSSLTARAPEYWQGYNEADQPDALALTLATIHHAGFGNFEKNKIGPNTRTFVDRLKPLLWNAPGPGSAFTRSFVQHVEKPKSKSFFDDFLSSIGKSTLNIAVLAALSWLLIKDK